jgi:hypothetical protein
MARWAAGRLDAGEALGLGLDLGSESVMPEYALLLKVGTNV